MGVSTMCKRIKHQYTLTNNCMNGGRLKVHVHWTSENVLIQYHMNYYSINLPNMVSLVINEIGLRAICPIKHKEQYAMLNCLHFSLFRLEYYYASDGMKVTEERLQNGTGSNNKNVYV